MANNLTNYQSTLLNMVANQLFDANLEYDKNVDYKLLVREARLQAVDLFVQLDKLNSLPKEVLDKHEKYKFSIINHNLNVEYQHNFLNEIMQQQDVLYCVLKGCASQYYYPKKWLRSMGDVDFLVKEEDLDKISNVFIEKGFSKFLEEHECHIVLKKEKMHLEMHFDLAGMPTGNAGEQIKEYISDIFEKAQLIQQDNVKYVQPSHFHHGIVIILHTYHHLLSEGIGLRHLCDLAVFFNSFTNEQFVEIFEEKLKKVGLFKFVQILACVCNKYLALPYRDWFSSISDELGNQIILDIFAGGNFGVKDGTRTKQGLAISDRGKSGVKEKGKFRTLFSNLNKITCNKWPFYKKAVILRPFGWLCLGVSYCFKVMFGKRKGFNAIKVINEADKRKAIYKQFQLFESEENTNGNQN